MSNSSNNMKKEKYLNALMTSSTKKEAYQAAHISHATANRFDNDPEFQKMYQQRRQKIMEFTGNRLRQLSSKAVETLARIMDSEEATPTEQTRAAKIVLDSAFQVANQQDILDRLDELEKEAAEQNES